MSQDDSQRWLVYKISGWRHARPSSPLWSLQTLVKVQKEYWIPCSLTVINKLIRNCGVCRRIEGASYSMPRMPHLPKEHVARSHSFEYTGIDYFGPLYVKEFPKVTGQIVERIVWVCLVTCFTVRTIHNELVEDMSTKEFLLCLCQFVARHGNARLGLKIRSN